MSKPTDKDAIETNKPITEEPKVNEGDKPRDPVDPENLKDTPPSDKSPQPVESPGTPAFDLSSHRITEIFAASDITFFREGPTGSVQAIPSHEAETRFAEITKRKSFFDDSKTVETLDLADGSKVTINGLNVIITPAEGPAEIDTASLNLKPADTSV